MTSVALAVNKMFHTDSSCTHASDPEGNDWNGFLCLCGDYNMCDTIVSGYAAVLDAFWVFLLIHGKGMLVCFIQKHFSKR